MQPLDWERVRSSRGIIRTSLNGGVQEEVAGEWRLDSPQVTGRWELQEQRLCVDWKWVWDQSKEMDHELSFWCKCRPCPGRNSSWLIGWLICSSFFCGSYGALRE